MWIIYKAVNQINGKIYIGQTKKGLKHRKYHHIRDAYCKRRDNHFQKAIKKYGPENFLWSVVEDNIDSIEKANEREQYWIKKYGSFKDRKKGYNCTSGGEKDKEMSKETKRKIGEKLKGNNFKGKRVLCIETEKEYFSVRACAKDLDINHTYICKKLTMVKIASIKGYHFKYI